MSINQNKFISDLADIIIGLNMPIEDEDVKVMIQNNIQLFTSAFTSDLKNDNEDKNYQMAETYGDKMLGVCFQHFMIKDKNIKTPGILTNLQSNLCSSITQPELTEKLGLHKFIDTSAYAGDLTKVKEDVFESFLGSLAFAIENSYGIEYVFPFMIQTIKTIYSFLNDSNILIYSQKNPKQVLKEVFDSVRMGKPHFIRKKEVNGSITIHVYRMYDKKDTKDKGDLQSVCSVNGKGEMSTYIKAVEQAMTVIGVTNGMIEDKRKHKNMNPDIRRLEEEIDNLLSPVGYGNIKYKIEKSNKITVRLWVHIEDLSSGEKFYITKVDPKRNKDQSMSDGYIYQGCLERILKILREKKSKGAITDFITNKARKYQTEITDIINQNEEEAADEIAEDIRSSRLSNRYIDSSTFSNEDGNKRFKYDTRNRSDRTSDNRSERSDYSRDRSSFRGRTSSSYRGLTRSYRPYKSGYRNPRTPLS